MNTTAYDKIDISLLNKHGVKLANLTQYATTDVAEVAVGMVLVLNQRLDIAREIVDGSPAGAYGREAIEPVSDIWPGHPISKYILRHQLRGQTVGIIGLGAIGTRCAALLQVFGTTVIGYNRSSKQVEGLKQVSLEELCQQSDIIVIAAAYEAGVNDKLVDARLLECMHDDAMLVSVAHPHLIELAYLIQHPQKFRGIGFDYLVTPEVRQLQKVRQHGLIITPHLGSQSFEAIESMTSIMIEAATGFADGKPKHLVN